MIRLKREKSHAPLLSGVFAGVLFSFGSVSAQAAERYIGDIFMTGAPYCPQGSLPTDGELLRVSDYSMLYSMIGTNFGGNGSSNFALPDLRGRAPVGAGQGIGLAPVTLGERNGEEYTILTPDHLPPHSHPPLPGGAISHEHAVAGHTHEGHINASPDPLTAPSPVGNSFGTLPPGVRVYSSSETLADPMNSEMIEVQPTQTTTQDTISSGSTGVTGNGEPIEIRSPSSTLQFCIVVNGVFPPRP